MAETVKNDKKELFESMPIPRALATLAVPTIISQMISVIYNMVDTFYIGRAGNPLMLAATSVSLTVMLINISFSNLFGIGGGSLMARLLGQQKTEEAKNVCAEMMEEAGVEVLMYVFCCGVLKDGERVKGVIIESKCGREAILAKTVIDCTGDGDVAFRAGVECHKGDAEGGMQPPTLMYQMRGVKMQELRDAIVGHPDVYDMDVMPPEQFVSGHFITVGLRIQIRKAQADGLDIPVSRTILITGLKPGTAVSLYTVAGQLVSTVTASGPTKTAVSVSQLPVGMYVVKANGVTYKIT